MYTLIGRVSFILDAEQKTETFAKRIVGIMQDGGYKPIPFEFINDKIKLVDEIKEGNDVRLHFNLHGSDWTNRDGKKNHTASLRPYKVEKLIIPSPADALEEFTDNLSETTK